MQATQATTFARTGAEGHPDLLAVAAGIPLDDAIEQASCRLGAALETLRSAACGLPATAESAAIWTAVYSLEVVYGILLAVEAGAMQQEVAP